MLDLATTLINLTVSTALQGIVWVLVWLTQRHLYELRVIATGFMAFAFGILLLVMRDAVPGPLFVILYNTIINAGVAMLADGTARFLGRPRHVWITGGCVAFTVIFWPTTLLVDPQNVAIRIIASNVLIVILLLHICWTLLRDRSQPAVVRWAAIAILLGDAVGLLFRTLHAFENYDDPTILNQASSQAWYFFSATVFTTGYFLALLLMVGVRLAADLQMKNEDLSREVTERRRLQEQLTATLETEKALRQEQKQLLRMVTHEFRTPLAIVDRAAEMIDVTLPDRPETVSKRLGSIRDAVQRLVQLIDRFLDAERRDLNVLQPERIDIRGLLDSVQRHFDGMEAAGRLHFTASRDLPFYHGDPDMLSTVLINLIDNALKYAPGDSPVEIAASVEDQAIVITITDQGIGIPETEMASIGRRFFRASNTMAATGTGLGLHNARQLLGYHMGKLSLRARTNGGTIATVRLPLPGVTNLNAFNEAV